MSDRLSIRDRVRKYIAKRGTSCQSRTQRLIADEIKRLERAKMAKRGGPAPK